MTLARCASLRLVALCLAVVALSNADLTVAALSGNQTLHLLWTYPSGIDDFGFSFAIDTARTYVERHFFDKGVYIASIYDQNTPTANCSDFIAMLLNQGYYGTPFDMWIVHGQQFTQCVETIDQDTSFDYLKIFQVAGVRPTNDLAVGFPALEQARFLHGILCATASQTKTLGYVASLPRSNSIISRGLNSFIVGAQSVNASINIVIAITGSFLDIVAEKEATRRLIEEHKADCIASQVNDLSVHAVASAHHVMSLGYTSDARYFVEQGEYVLSSMLLRLEQMLTPVIESFINDTWVPNLALASGYELDAITLSGPSPLVEKAWGSSFKYYIDSFKAQNFSVFCEPYFTDPQYINAQTSYYTPFNMTCLQNTSVWNMTGVINNLPNVKVVIEYNSTVTPYENVYIFWNSSHSIASIVLTGILMVAAALAAFDVINNQNNDVYYASSPLFCLLILTGVMIGCVSSFLWIGNPTKYTCMARWWLSGIAYTLIYSCITAKNYRILRIFSSHHLKIVTIMNSELLLRWVAVLVGIEVFILIFWQIFDPQVPVASASHALDIHQLQIMCLSQSGKSIGIGIFIAYNCLILVPAAIISYLTRNTKEIYRESLAIAIVIYSSIVIYVIAIGVTVAASTDYVVIFYMGSYGSYLLMLVSFIALFLPKIYTVHSLLSKSESQTTSGQNASVLESEPGRRRDRTTGSFGRGLQSQANASLNLNSYDQNRRIPSWEGVVQEHGQRG